MVDVAVISLFSLSLSVVLSLKFIQEVIMNRGDIPESELREYVLFHGDN